MTAVIQRSFSGGEISPSLYGRVDLTKYATGLRKCRNFAVARHGGVFNRPGTEFIAEVKDSTKTVRLLPFIFNETQTYVLEFGDLYMRVFREGTQVRETEKNITGATQANPCQITSNAHGFSNGQEVYISSVGGMTELNARWFKVAGVAANTFTLQYMDGTNVNSTAFGAYTTGGTAARVYEISTPYVEADLQSLQIAQSADVITIVHPNYAPRELTRTGHTSWALATITFAPSQAAPTGVAVSGSAGAISYTYHVTAVASETYEESLAATKTQGSLAAPTTSTAHTITWVAASGAAEYNIYLVLNGVPGFIGTAIGTSFVNDGIVPDTSDTPPTARNPFNATGDYPSTVAYSQQRLTFANTDNNPEKIWTSQTGNFHNMTSRTPIQADDAVTFSLVGKNVNEVRHLVELSRLVALTSGTEWVINGDADGILTPTAINASQQSYHGSSELSPILIDSSALYVQARGTIIRDYGFDYQIDGYRGNDLTIFSTHLFDGYTVRDWAYQKTPNSIVWVVRSDGTLLGLTYVKEHQLIAWHRHDTDGTFEQVCAIPEGVEDSLYTVVERTINGSTKRYIERMYSRSVQDVIDNVFMDCALSYDGRNTSLSHTMTLSGGTTWAYDETITLTSSASFFTASDVGNEIHLTGADGELIRFTIQGYTSGLIVTGTPNRTVPTSLRTTATTDWARAVDQLGGLWHLEGETLSVFADRFVVASPNDDGYTAVTVANGTATLDHPYAVVHVGLPYISDLETLDIDTPGGETMADKKKLVSGLTVFVESSRGGWAGTEPPLDDTVDPLENLTEFKTREAEDYDSPPELETGTIDVNIRSGWNSHGRLFLRQVDPLPISVLAVAPTGILPFGRG